MRLKRKYLLLLGLGLCLSPQAGGIAWSQVTERVSVDTTGSDADSASSNPSTSSNGSYVAFQSDATDLVAGGSNGSMHIFVRDRQTPTTTQVSVDSAGNEANAVSSSPSISSDGRYVAFESNATNLLGVGNDNNGWPDIFVHDRDADGDGMYDEAGEVSTIRVSVYSDETESIDPSNNPSISADGRYVAFASGGELDLTAIEILTLFDVFVHDRDTDGDGQYDEPGEVSTVQVSVDSTGAEGIGGDSSSCSISANGRYVAFVSDATNLVGVGNDNNGSTDVFVHDRDTDRDGQYDEPGAVSTVRVSVDSAGVEGDNNSNFPSISGDGRYVAFESNATNLVGVGNDNNGSTDVFIHDQQTGATTRVSVDLAGVEGNGNSNAPSISADGSSVTFESDATNLVGVGNDNNGAPDIFADDLQAGAGGGGGDGNSGGGCFISTAAYESRMQERNDAEKRRDGDSRSAGSRQIAAGRKPLGTRD